MDNGGMDFNAINEARRRIMGQAGSGAGIPGGMQASNAPMASNPINAMGANTSAPPSPTQPNAPTQSDGGMSAMGQAVPGEASAIIKSLIKQLDRLTAPKEAPMM
jgi:hypothetical protein